MIKTSIIIPTLNEENYIASCLESVIGSDIDKSTTEVLVVDGKSSDETVNIVKSYMQKYSFIKLFINEKRIIPAAMNIGIKNSHGEYIIRIDAHSFYPKDYFTNLLKYSQKLDAVNVGGTCVTDVKNKTPKTESIKVVMSHKYGVGGGDYRKEIKVPKISNTVPFGCFKKEALLKSGFFDERLHRGEDLEINKRLIDDGGDVYLVPEVSFVYYSKERLRDLAKKSFSTGRWIILTAYFTKAFKALHLRHFAPLVLILSWLLPLFFCAIDSIFCIVSLLSLISYVVAVVFLSVGLKKRNNSFFYLVATFMTLHISFGIGSIFGIGEALINYLRGNS